MERKLLLSNLGFPDKFLSSSITPPAGFTKQQYMEQKVLDSINLYNPKLKISNIEYLDINDQFPNLRIGKYAGVIVEDTKIEGSQEGLYREKGHYVWKATSEWIARRIVIYVFLSDYEVKGRNIISQSIFPEIIDYMGLFHSSPSYSIANHPIYYLNFLSEKITAPTIIKQIAGMIASKIEYIEVFVQNEELKKIPSNIYEYISTFEKDFVAESDSFVSDYFEINFASRKVTIKTDKLVIGDYLILKNDTGPEYQFKGSSEKFYWMEIIPIAVLACENEYKIDYSQLEEFYNENKGNFSKTDEKFNRFSLLNKFLEKLVLRREA